MAHAARETGLTLVEMLVVLAIIGILASVTLLGIGGGNRTRAGKIEAARLADRLRFAADDVRVAERPLAFAWDARGYSFVDWDAKAGRWQADRSGQLGPRHDLPAGITLAVDGARPPVAIAADGAGPVIEARIASASARWTVAFDGLDARVAADAAP